MRMQFKKIAAAGTLSALMMGASVGFAALSNFPSPFVTSSGVQSFVVVGAAAAPSDVVGAVDLAARLGGSVTTDVSVAGAVGGYTVSGEGKALDTATTRVFLNDDLGKSGLRTTLTKDDLPTLLAKGSFADADGTHKYDQYIDMTPGTASGETTRLDFDKPGSSSSADPSYNFGRFTTSPSTTEYLYRVRVVFDVAVSGNASVSKSLKLFGNDYTISGDTSATFTGGTSDKVVLFGGADIQTMTGGQSITTTVSGTTYEVKLLGVTSTGSAVVQVGGTSETITKGSTSSNFGDLKIYVKDTASLSTTDQTQNVATLLIGADRLTLQDSAKVKKGNNDDNVDGTWVVLTRSGVKLSTITVYFAARSSTEDFVASGSSAYMNQVFSTFGVQFPGVSPAVSGASDDQLTVKNSGDNNLQLTVTDYNSNQATVNYGYKATSSAQDISLADSSGNNITVVEGATVARDQYVVLDAGGFPHMFKVSSVSLDGSTSASIDLQDVFTGTTTKITTGTDNQEAGVIDGQTYYFNNVSSTTFNVTWGTSASLAGGRGTYNTVWPKLKTKSGAMFSFIGAPVTGLPTNITYELPTGAVQINATYVGAAGESWVIALTAWNREDGTTSSVTANDALGPARNSTTFQLGRTTTGGLYYQLTKTSATAFTLGVLGASNGSVAVGNASLVVFEEKDDAGSQGAVFLPGATGSSGSNYLAGIGTVGISGTNSGSQTWGSNSNKASYADIWGTVVERDTSTSAQPWVSVHYPDTQRIASLYVVAKGATISSTTGASGTVVKTATPVKTPLGKLDTEVTSADKSTKRSE